MVSTFVNVGTTGYFSWEPQTLSSRVCVDRNCILLTRHWDIYSGVLKWLGILNQKHYVTLSHSKRFLCSNLTIATRKKAPCD